MNRISRIELVVTLNRVLNLPVIDACDYVSVAEADAIGSGAASEREEIAEKCRAVDFERFHFGRVRDAKPVGHEERQPQISEPAWPFGVAGKNVLAQIQDIRRCPRWTRWKTGDARVPVSTSKVFGKIVILL